MAKRYVDLIPYMALLRRDDLKDGQSDTTDVSGTVKFKILKENIENKVLGFEQNLKKIEEDIRLADTFNEVVELSRGLSKFTKKSHKETVTTLNGDKINIKEDTQHLVRDISAKLGTLRSQLQNSQSLDEAVAIAQLVRDAKIILDS